MANWKYTLDLRNSWDKPVDELGKIISRELINMVPQSWLDYDSEDFDSDLDEIVEFFNNITGYDDVTPEEEFDEAMWLLYEWADQEISPFHQWPSNKMMWIRTVI